MLSNLVEKLSELTKRKTVTGSSNQEITGNFSWDSFIGIVKQKQDYNCKGLLPLRILVEKEGKSYSQELCFIWLVGFRLARFEQAHGLRT